MSCDKCDKAQEEGVHTYVRVEKGNVLISGCHEHLKMLIEELRGRRE